MKAILSALLALALAGCSRPSPVPPPAPAAAEIPLAEMQGFAMGQSPDVDLLLRAVEGLTNRAEVLARYKAAWDSALLESLVNQGEKELRRKLDTATRGTSSHGYTTGQLHTALAVKAARKAARDAKRVVHTDPALLTTNADGW